MTELPNSVYAVVGILILTNLSAVISFIVFIFKAGVFVQGTKMGIKDAKESSVRAHKRIDKLEQNEGI